MTVTEQDQDQLCIVPVKIQPYGGVLLDEDEQPLGGIQVNDLHDRAQVRKAKSASLRWAKAHPDLTGWIVVAEYLDCILRGYPCEVILVGGGSVRLGTYEQAMPKFQARWQARQNAIDEQYRERDRWKKAHLRHPSCPACTCTKRSAP